MHKTERDSTVYLAGNEFYLCKSCVLSRVCSWTWQHLLHRHLEIERLGVHVVTKAGRAQTSRKGKAIRCFGYDTAPQSIFRRSPASARSFGAVHCTKTAGTKPVANFQAVRVYVVVHIFQIMSEFGMQNVMYVVINMSLFQTRVRSAS